MKSCSRDDLIEVLAGTERPRSEWRIGAESEKFGVHRETGAPLAYEGTVSVLGIFERLIERRGWRPITEVPGGPIISLTKGAANITLEPGGQLELSGAPLVSVHDVAAEQRRHLAEVESIAAELGVVWLMTGFHPLARQDELPWVPKQRYSIMREYLPGRGDGALDMMRRTATVQGNFDWSSEQDALLKLRVALKLSPVVHALFANAPFREGRLTESASLRGDVWLRMDPARSGLIQPVLDNPKAGYVDYVEWALDAGMFLIRRGDRILRNTGQTFRDFLESGYQGERAQVADFRLHLNTLFPEARLKGTLELRSADCVPPELAESLLALWTGIIYDDEALDRAAALTESWSFADLESRRHELVQRGPLAELFGRRVVDFGEVLLDIATGGLERRGLRDEQGRTEAVLLAPLGRLVAAGHAPADEARIRFDKLRAESLPQGKAIVEATRLASSGESVS